MGRIRVISVGKQKSDFAQEGIAEYLKRMRPFAKIELVDLNLDKFSKLPRAEQQRKETEAVIEKIASRESLIALDESGKAYDSMEFSEMLSREHDKGDICFVIGGAYGWDKSMLERAKITISLSPLTFNHQLSKLVLIEQIYRGFTIIKKMPYHK